jgi:hypothetical protein
LVLLFAPVVAYFTLLAFDSVEKDRCSQQVGTSTGRNVFCDELTVESPQPLPALRRSASARRENGSRAGFHEVEPRRANCWRERVSRINNIFPSEE